MTETPLRDRTFRHLFMAQVIALAGTGLLTIALGLLAYDLAGPAAGAVLGTAFAIKMAAYVFLAPLMQALAARLPRRALLVTLDLVRAGIALFLPFVTEIWQVYVLIFVLQAASAAFTPALQAVIPDILPDEDRYTRALSLTRLAYDLESLGSPLVAAALLSVMDYGGLFVGTVAGFLVSAALVARVRLPAPAPADDAGGAGLGRRSLHGIRIYLATPRLRGLLALNVAVAAAGAMVIVNTVVIVRAELGQGQGEVALAMAAFGAGSMAAALVLPRLLQRLPDRPTMLAAGALLAAGLSAGPFVAGLGGLALLWAALGLGYSAVLTPAGRLLRRSAGRGDRPALFAAQFALSHACWLLAYPLAGWLGAQAGMAVAFVVLAGLAAAGLAAALGLWPAEDERVQGHVHDDLPPDHPHLREFGQGVAHRHPAMADGLHPRPSAV